MTTETEGTQIESAMNIKDQSSETPLFSKSERIRELNDFVRHNFIGGVVLVTAGVQALDDKTKAELLAAVRAFNEFGPDNDPHHEHDFGSLEIDGETYFFKFDYFDLAMRFHSPDPADPNLTRRALTIMRADEY